VSLRPARNSADNAMKHPDLKRIRLLVLDFDGVLTDNRVFIDENGKEYVICSRADGIGLTEMKKMGIGTLVLSTEPNPVVSRRCRKLKVECVQGCNDKWGTLNGILKKRGVS